MISIRIIITVIIEPKIIRITIVWNVVGRNNNSNKNMIINNVITIVTLTVIISVIMRTIINIIAQFNIIIQLI